MRPPLWLDIRLDGSEAVVRLAKCRNCGKVKATSDPCGFDHLAAVLEFKAAIEAQTPTEPAATEGRK